MLFTYLAKNPHQLKISLYIDRMLKFLVNIHQIIHNLIFSMQSVAYDRSSAPKDCHIYGLIEEHSNDDPLDKIIEKAILLKEFTYDLEKKNVQTFNIEKHGSPVAVNAVRFNFSSNHGSPSYTCIYRLRVHGHEPN